MDFSALWESLSVPTAFHGIQKNDGSNIDLLEGRLRIGWQD